MNREGGLAPGLWLGEMTDQTDASSYPLAARVMLEVFIKLLEKLAELSTLQKDQRQAFYSSEVGPLLDDFKHVHSHYLDQFKFYRDTIENGSDSLPSVTKQAITDRLFSMHTKIDLLTRVNHSEGLRPVATAMRRYFHWEGFVVSPDTIPYGDEIAELGLSGAFSPMNAGYWMINALNVRQIEGLVALRANDRELSTGRAIEDIDNIVEELQQRYANVIQSFELKRRELLEN